MADIFLSYNRQDQETAALFVQGFEAAGLSVWWDVALRAGEVYDETTEQALREAGAVIVLWSQRSVVSRWVRAEATLAQRIGSLVPCMIEPCSRPIMFELVQTADLIDWRGDTEDAEWRNFIAHIRTHLAQRNAEGPAGRDADTPRPAAMPGKPASERRQVTFLSAAFADSDAMASALDPEDWHDAVEQLQKMFDPIVIRFGGRADWAGDGMSAVFGYPLAHEDAAERAIRAALALRDAFSEAAPDIARLLATEAVLRIGIHSSNMLIKAADDGNPEMFGDGAAVATAARNAAKGGEILVSEAIYQLSSGAFELEPAGGNDAKALYRVARVRSADRTGRGWAADGRTVFVGREDELMLLRSRWKRACEGEGQFVLIRGEPGIGKTRLVEQFHGGLDDDEFRWIALHGSSMFPNTPYHALRRWFEQLAEDRGGEAEAALADALGEFGLDDKLLPLLAPEIGLELPEQYQQPNLTQEQKRSQLLANLGEAVFMLAKNVPLILLLDDLQWIDPSTLELAQMLVEQSERDRLLIIGTARTEFRPPWSEREHHSRINLARLSQKEIRALVLTAASEADIDTETIDSILDRADGVPLFAEELVRLLKSSEGQSAASIPPTLRGLLAARMDRLGPARELLQLAAVAGREFPYSLLAKVSGEPPETLDDMLGTLADEQLLFMRGAPPDATYRFRHALVQDAAYETLPKRRQREWHGKIALTIEAEFPEMADSQGELLATHWTRAGETDRAVAAWNRAGEGAYERAACKEAAAHFRQALAVLATAPEGSARDEREMELWSALNRTLQQLLGYADPQTVQATEKSLALAKKAGVLDKVLTEEAQLWRAAITRGDYREADAIAEQVIRMSEELGENADRPWLDYFKANAKVQTDFYTGRIKIFENDFAALRASLQKETLDHSPLDDVVAIGVGSLAAWMAGRSDVGKKRAAEVIALGDSSGHPYAVAVSHHFAGTFAAFDRDFDATLDYTTKALEVCDKNGFAYIGHLCRAKFGWVHAREGTVDEDIAAMRLALEEMAKADAMIALTFNMNRLAIALEKNGQRDAALQVAEEALIANPQERIVRPQTLEIRGRLKESAGDSKQAANDFHEALDLAGEMGALAFELSAALHLARLHAGEGHREEAVKILENCLAGCPEQTDTPDLPVARAYLDELSAKATG